MEKRITITETKFITKDKTSLINEDGQETFREKLYFEVTGIDDEGKERHRVEFELINIPLTNNFNKNQETRRKIYAFILKNRFGVDGKVPNKKTNPNAWDFYINNIGVFYPIELFKGETKYPIEIIEDYED